MKNLLAVDSGFSRSRGFWATRIRSTTDSWWCHAFTRFRFTDGSCRIFESRLTIGGFKEIDPARYDLQALAEHGVETDVEAVAFVPLLESENDPRIADALKLCEQWDGAKSYPLFQLVAIWLSHRYGMKVPVSKDKLICSEALAVIAHKVGVDLRDVWHPNFDSVTPGSAWNNLMTIRAGYGENIMRNKEAATCGVSFFKYYSLQPSRP